MEGRFSDGVITLIKILGVGCLELCFVVSRWVGCSVVGLVCLDEGERGFC